MRRVGILGGTFDPIHIGHLVAAMNAKAALDLDQVLMVVAHRPWQKVGSRRISSSELRFAMTEAAVADLDGIDASTIEIDRGGDSYTIDTVETLRAVEPDTELFLVIGTDVAAQLHTWHRDDELQGLVTIAVVQRPGSIGVDVPPGWRAVGVEAPLIDLSSSDLRRRLEDDLPVRYLIPDAALSIYRAWQEPLSKEHDGL